LGIHLSDVGVDLNPDAGPESPYEGLANFVFSSTGHPIVDELSPTVLGSFSSLDL